MQIRIAAAAGVLAAAAGFASPGLAQTNCGLPTVGHTMRQTPNYKQSVDISASTTRPVNTCLLEVQTEAWVDALSPKYISSARNLYSAAVSQTRAVPSLGTWHSTAKHWLIWTASGVWNNLGNTYAQAKVVAPPTSGGACLLTPDDCPEGYEFESWRCDCVTLSPILIDTAGDGYRLTSADDGVTFDLDANGIVVEKVAWTDPTGDDAWLVMDRNGNGRIDSGAELFGSRSPAYADTSEPIAPNGYDALLLTEGPTYGLSKPDRIIDAHDAVFARLQLWLDRNHNGLSEAEELMPLEQAGIVAIRTDYKEESRRDQYGNRFSLKGTAVFRGPQGQPIERNIYDVFLTVAGPSRR
jgi:hypothetical protein